MKRRFGYDDSLDVFGVHGVGGFLGTVLVAIFASDVFGGNQAGLAIGRQLAIQLGAAVFTVVYSAGVTWGILRAVAALTELRVDEAQERRGLDISIHGEEGYHL